MTMNAARETVPYQDDSLRQDESLRTVAWYALKVHTRSEAGAATALRNKGYEVFAPVHNQRRKYSDRVKVVGVAAFPGYIFCRFSAQNKVPVLKSPSVDYIVGSAGGLTPIDDSEIDAVRRVIEAGAAPVPFMPVGQRVRIEYGSLAGIEGFLTRLGAENRLILSVHLLQRSVSLTIGSDQVRAV